MSIEVIFVLLYFFSAGFLVYSIYRKAIWNIPVASFTNSVMFICGCIMMFVHYGTPIVVAILATIPMHFLHSRTRVHLSLYLADKLFNKKN